MAANDRDRPLLAGLGDPHQRRPHWSAGRISHRILSNLSERIRTHDDSEDHPGSVIGR